MEIGNGTGVGCVGGYGGENQCGMPFMELVFPTSARKVFSF